MLLPNYKLITSLGGPGEQNSGIRGAQMGPKAELSNPPSVQIQSDDSAAPGEAEAVRGVEMGGGESCV
jgi:hypothetical protein